MGGGGSGVECVLPLAAHNQENARKGVRLHRGFAAVGVDSGHSIELGYR